MSKIAISYRKNPLHDDANLKEPRLFASISLAQYGLEGRVSDLPVYFRNLEQPVGPVRVVYSTRVAGLTLEAGNLEALADTVDTVLTALVRRERLPLYVFNVGDNAWPIFRFSKDLLTRYPGGPVFSAPTIAELWIALADHFKRIGRIESRRDLGILYLSPADLQLYAPDFSLRFLAAADIPVFPVANGQRPELVAPVGSQALRLPIEGGAEIMAMYRKVGARLVDLGRLASPYDMSIRKLASTRWEQARRSLQPVGQALVYYTEEKGKLTRQQAPIFGDGVGFLAARKSWPTGVTVYAGPDLRALQGRMGEELYQRGVITSPGAVYVGSIRSESLQKQVSILDQVLNSRKSEPGTVTMDRERVLP